MFCDRIILQEKRGFRNGKEVHVKKRYRGKKKPATYIPTVAGEIYRSNLYILRLATSSILVKLYPAILK